MNGQRPKLFAGGGRKPNLTLIGLRLNRGLSPNELAGLVDVSAETIRLAEKGHIPSPRVMFELAGFFEVEVVSIWPLKGQERPKVIA
jgi:DNA-binding XRE family transcriptional regulator